MAEAIRVLQVVGSFNIESGGGGEERFVTELVQALDRSKFKVTVCGLWERSTTQEVDRMRDLEAMGISTFTAAQWNDRYPYRSMWHAMLGLRAA